MKNILIILLAILIVNSCTTKQLKIEKDLSISKFQNLNESIQESMNKENIIGLSIAIIDGHHTLWINNFGYEDKNKKKKTTVESMYRVGSITKLFTTMGIMKLQEDQAVNIDAPVKNYLTDFQFKHNKVDNVTLRSIMTHHSGV